MTELEKLAEHEKLFLINGDMWWTKEDVACYDYLKISHANEMENIIPYLKGHDVAIQAGSHCGYVIKELLPYFKSIYTFEPNHTMFLALCMNIPNKNVFKFQACLGNEHKLVSMSGIDGLPVAGDSFINGNGIIPMFIIDDLNLNNCDLLMLDTEGYEYNALMGAKNTIEKFKPLLCIERYWGQRTLGIPESQMDTLLNNWKYKMVSKAGESDYIYQYKR